jgi:hypothetical protein
MYVKGAEQVKNKQELIKKISDKASLNKLVLLDYSNDSLCSHAEYFADPFHMNETGSKLFTLKLVSHLKPFFNNSLPR